VSSDVFSAIRNAASPAARNPWTTLPLLRRFSCCRVSPRMSPPKTHHDRRSSPRPPRRPGKPGPPKNTFSIYGETAEVSAVPVLGFFRLTGSLGAGPFTIPVVTLVCILFSAELHQRLDRRFRHSIPARISVPHFVPHRHIKPPQTPVRDGSRNELLKA
jgi:hypothetical protein